MAALRSRSQSDHSLDEVGEGTGEAVDHSHAKEERSQNRQDPGDVIKAQKAEEEETEWAGDHPEEAGNEA